jgi:glucuronoarabinoxylan endo-1,4-beta-xylanase
VLSLAPISYGQGPIYLDFDQAGDVNTQLGFDSILIADSGKTVNGITVELAGNIDSRRRANPYGVPYEQIYRDFIFGTSSNAITITLWGLGEGRECEITIYSFDDGSGGTRSAIWTANGAYILTTAFSGGSANWPTAEDSYAFTGTGFADGLGRIVLTCTQAPGSGTPFAFVNALVVVPKGDFIPIKYASYPQPLKGQQDVPVNAILSWEQGSIAAEHDVYLGTDRTSVEYANRTNPMGVLVSQGHDANTYDPCGLLKLNTTYYWRIDEVNDPNFWTGEVWSFATLSSFIIENFDSYATDDALREKWKDNLTNGTRAFISLEDALVLGGNSMMYEYRNSTSPHYSQAYADIAGLGIDDPNWLGIGAEALVLYFRGEPNNPIGESMYVSLTDGDSPPKTAAVTYHTMQDIKVPQWQKWNIPLTEFNDVNLANVAGITIGFGDGSGSGEGTVYFEDILLDIKAEGTIEAAGAVDLSAVYQELEGFGASIAWLSEVLVPLADNNPGIYDVIFGDLGLDILRLRNTYGYTGNDVNCINQCAEIISEGRARTGRPLKIMMSSWSPQASLKSNGTTTNGGTLKKDGGGNYMYSEFADWWADSLTAWDNNGVVVDYVNIQNEPNWAASWDTCLFDPIETPTIAGYNQAFEAVYQELYSRMGSAIPKMLAPESEGFYLLQSYIDALIDANHVYGYAHHLYNDGGTAYNPDGYIPAMTNFAAQYGDRPLLQTEFSDDTHVTSYDAAIDLAVLMYNSLVIEQVSAYLYWELVWYQNKGLVGIASSSWTINPVYYAFKHYSALTDPGWRRVGASADSNSLRISAFKSPDSTELTIVIINVSDSRVVLTLALNGFSPDSSVLYRSTSIQYWSNFGPFSPIMSLPPESITTINLTGSSSPNFSNCDEVLTAGYGLTSDISGDCYVNYKDLKIITDYWLSDDCGWFNDYCDGADLKLQDGNVDLIDFSRFTSQWLLCNDPEDTGCVHNW